MKRTLIFLIAIASALRAQETKPENVAGQTPPPPDAVSPPPPVVGPGVDVGIHTPEAKAAQEEFKKLPAEKQEEFFKLLNDGEKLMAERRVPEALQKFNDAEALWGKHPNLINLKGAALVNIRDFERAAEYFQVGSKLYPEFWQTRFNLAEMNFVRGEWATAEKQFRDLLENEKALQDPNMAGTRKLLDFKIILTYIKRQNFDAATEAMKKYDIYDDTPIYFYLNAALNFEKKNQKEAEEWVSNARQIYDKNLNAIYEDSLTELGWLFVF